MHTHTHAHLTFINIHNHFYQYTHTHTHTHTHTFLPPLAYSITRYNVFSVSITSNNFTAGRNKHDTHEPKAPPPHLTLATQKHNHTSRYKIQPIIATFHSVNLKGEYCLGNTTHLLP